MYVFEALEVGNRLLKYRNELHLSQFEVAEAAGISGRTYADIERGETNMRVGTLISICNALKVSPNDVLIGREHSEKTLSISELVELLECSDERTRMLVIQIIDILFKSGKMA